MTGTQLREKTISSRSGRQLHMRVIRPDPSLDNMSRLVQTYRRWHGLAEAVESSDPKAAAHAEFAAQVAWLVATRLRQWSAEPQEFLIVVAVDEKGEVLGINTAYWVPNEQVWYMAVGTTRPEDQPGYPNPDQFRGIGLEVVGALVALMNGIVCAPVTLEPLDQAARSFWARRGFHDQGEEMRMTCPESRQLEARLAHSEVDDPEAGDEPFFTDPSLLRGWPRSA